MIDYIKYGDTDSIMISINEFIDNNGLGDIFNSLTDDGKISMIIDITKNIEDYVNNKIYRELQRKCYNSPVTDFRINFKQEIIAKSALFIKKKKYAFWCVNEEGAPVDKISIIGLEIVRSDSSEAVRIRMKDIMEMILKDADEREILRKISLYKKELMDVFPEEIAANIGVNNIDKYIKNGKPTKGTPWHVKGVANYRFLLKELNIEDKYEDIHEGIKARVVYIKKNRFGIDIITFLRWPKEFDNHVEIDYNIMIEKFFVKKIETLLEPMNKVGLLNGKSGIVLSTFFG